MEEDFKKLDIENGDKNSDDEKETRRLGKIIFIPLIFLTLLTFKFQNFRTIFLLLLFLLLASIFYSELKKVGYSIKKLDKAQIWFIVIITLALFYKFFADLVLTFLTLFFFYILMLSFSNFNVKKSAKAGINLIFLSSWIIPIILNYEGILIILKKLWSFI